MTICTTRSEQSCDVYFYEISNDIGIDRMHDYLDQVRAWQSATGIDVRGESAPAFVPSQRVEAL